MMAADSILGSFLADQGYALFEYLDSGVFRPIGDYPKWCEKIWKGALAADRSIRLADASPFIENFLVDAEGFWNSNREGSANSPVWIERDSGGHETPLEASALHLDGKNVMILRNLSRTYAERQQFFQTARSSILEHERLLREIQKKEILLHCIVHDLSQPLTAMRGVFSLLSLEELPANLHRTVETGQRESDRQEQMIRGILKAFSADLAGQQIATDESSSAVDLTACAQRAVQDFSPAFNGKQIRLQLDPAVDLTRDWNVVGDAERLDRIFGNLLENALRYSPKDTVVTIGAEDQGEFVLAYVDDQGPGLPKDEPADRMFALFAKGKEKPGKAGLGLYFCKITVGRWGGSIGAETKASGGSRFWFRLPRASKSPAGAARNVSRAKKQQEAAAKSLGSGSRLALEKPAKALRILVAEDTDDNRELVTELLKKRGHSVVGVSDGRQALNALTKGEFDVVLMDEQMPGMGGLEATRAIRERERGTGKRQTVVALTGNISEEDKQRRIQAGMDGFVPKPFEMRALFDTIEFLANFGDQVIQAKPIEPPEPTPPVPEPLAPSQPAEDVATHLRRTTDGNEKLIKSLTNSFLGDAPKRLAAIRTAIAAKDAAKLDAASHALKGSLGIFGAQKAVSAAKNLEAMGRSRKLEGADLEFRTLEAAMKTLKDDLQSLLARKKSKPARPPARRRK